MPLASWRSKCQRISKIYAFRNSEPSLLLGGGGHPEWFTSGQAFAFILKVPSCLMVLCRLLRLILLCLIPLADILQFGDGSMLESLPELELEGPLPPQPGVGGELGPLHWAQSKTRTLVASYSSRWQSWSPSTGWETCLRGSWGAQFSVLKHLWYSVTLSRVSLHE